jgi:hypothetical protein
LKGVNCGPSVKSDFLSRQTQGARAKPTDFGEMFVGIGASREQAKKNVIASDVREDQAF